MNERFVPGWNSYEASSYLFRPGWDEMPMHSVSIHSSLIVGISKETLGILHCKCNACRCAHLPLGATGLCDSMAIASYIHLLA